MSRIGHNNPPPEAPPAPSALDTATDAMSSTLWGSLVGIEAHFDGDLRATGLALDKALEKFLASIDESEGEAVAEQFAKRLRATCNRFVKERKDAA